MPVVPRAAGAYQQQVLRPAGRAPLGQPQRASPTVDDPCADQVSHRGGYGVLRCHVSAFIIG